MLNRSLPSAYRSANMGVDIFESSFTDKASLEKLNTDEYFHKYAPRTWDFGRFSTFCNELPGFPQINRNPCARFLWDHNLEKLTTCNDSKMRDRAMRLLNIAGDVNINSTNTSRNVVGSQSRVESTHESSKHPSTSSSKSVPELPAQKIQTSSEPARELMTNVNPKPSRGVSVQAPTNKPHEPTEPQEPGDHEPKTKSKRKSLLVEAPGYEAERSASPSPGPAAQVPPPPPPPRPPLKKFRSSLPRPPSKRPSSGDDQSGRQKLIHLRETMMRDFRSSITEIGSLATEAHRLHDTYLRLYSRLDSQLEGIINDPQIRASDTMLTDKDDDGDGDVDSEADTVPLPGRA